MTHVGSFIGCSRQRSRFRRSKSPGAHHAETAILLESCLKLCHCMARDGPFPRSSAVRNSSRDYWVVAKFPAVFPVSLRWCSRAARAAVQFSNLHSHTFVVSRSNTPMGILGIVSDICSTTYSLTFPCRTLFSARLKFESNFRKHALTKNKSSFEL